MNVMVYIIYSHSLLNDFFSHSKGAALDEGFLEAPVEAPAEAPAEDETEVVHNIIQSFFQLIF